MVRSSTGRAIRVWLAVLPLATGSQAFSQTTEQAQALANTMAQVNARRVAEAERAQEEQRKATERAASLALTAKWRPATKEELAMTSDPRAPGAAAVYLYTEFTRDDGQRRELVYRQIKVLTEQGRDLANISLSYDKKRYSVSRFEARVIQPDGKILPYKGKIYDRPLASSRQMSWRAKSVALPDVHVGSVVEYRYWREFRDSEPVKWTLNQDLFARHARFSLQPAPGGNPSWTYSRALPAGSEGVRIGPGGVIVMDAYNMPPLVLEDNMPPLEDLVLSVDFTNGPGSLLAQVSPSAYWRAFSVAQWQAIEAFLGDPDLAALRLRTIVGNDDGAEQQVRKIHEHVRRLGNVDVPESMDEKTAKQCRRIRQDALEVGKDGCGNSGELQLYFLALVRAAGIPAVPVLAASRAERFFVPESKESSRIDDLLIAVTIDHRELLLNPAVPFLPYGSLFWFETAVPGLRLTGAGGEWFTTPMPSPAEAAIRRKARFALTEDGALEGTVVVRYSGHEAVKRVMQMFLADEQTRISVLEQDLRRSLAVPADIKVSRQPDWRDNSGNLEIEYRVKVRDWTLAAGGRLMVGIGLFGGEQVGKFTSAKREQPIYFEHPFITEDELEIILPAGFKLQNAPSRQVSPDAALKYVTSAESNGEVLTIRRSLTHNLLLALQSQYPRVKGFYEMVRSGDQDQVILAK